MDTAPPDLDTELAWESVGGSGIVLDSWVLGSAVLLGIFPSLCTAEFGAEGSGCSAREDREKEV